jgi:RHS repeat-associated protein
MSSLTDPENNTTSLTWDYEDRLTTVDNPSGDDHVYEYDGDGMRVRSGHDSGQGNVWDTRFYYDVGAPLYAYLFESDNAKNMTGAYTIDPAGGLISQRRNGATYYHHYDALGSTRLLTDASQTVTDTYDYYAFGEVQSSSGSTANPFKFVGRLGYYDDPSADLQYLRARYYAPAYGRFLSADPEDYEETKYGYADNWPLVATDPSGRRVTIDPSCAGHKQWIWNQVQNACAKAWCIGSCCQQDYRRVCWGGNLTIVCEDPSDLGCAVGTPDEACGYIDPNEGMSPNCTVHLCPAGLAVAPGCPVTLGCLILHEMTHCAGANEGEARACEQECCQGNPVVPGATDCCHLPGGGF